MSYCAYSDRSGIISFGSGAGFQAGQLLVAKSTSFQRLHDAIGSIAHHDRALAVFRVPGMATRDPGDTLAALGQFQRRVELLLADGGC